MMLSDWKAMEPVGNRYKGKEFVRSTTPVKRSK